jgi:hypothetical protein
VVVVVSSGGYRNRVVIVVGCEGAWGAGGLEGQVWSLGGGVW